MGAGCYYTNDYYFNDKVERIRACWLEVSYLDKEEYLAYADHQEVFETYDEYLQYNTEYEDTLELLKEYIVSNTTYDKDLENKLYKLSFESTYNGDGIVIKQGIWCASQLEGLAAYNFERCYYALCNKLVKAGFKLRIATSSYTSGEYCGN